VGIDARGFLLASPLAYVLGCGFVMVRKKGKLPGAVVGYDYALEYGTASIELQQDAIKAGDRVVVCDDLLATGGTMEAAITLLKKQGADVALAAFVMELSFLSGRARLQKNVGVDCYSLLDYAS
jgi:adenine phosphoribosyltransferase